MIVRLTHEEEHHTGQDGWEFAGLFHSIRDRDDLCFSVSDSKGTVTKMT